jgi:hypothetical protein
MHFSIAKPISVASLGLTLAAFACSSAGDSSTPIHPSTGAGGTSQATSGTGMSGAGTSSGGNGPASTTSTVSSGGSAGDMTTAGAGGVTMGTGGVTAGAGGSGGASAGGGGSGGATTDGGAIDGGGGGSAGDTPSARPLNFQAGAGQRTHTINGQPVGVYGGVPHMMGKLIVNLDNAVYTFGLKRGFHVMGANLPVCPINYTTRQHNGDCRLEVFDGVDRVSDFAVTPAESVTGQVTTALKQLQMMYPEEDWGYYLNTDGTVRWSDVGFTGHSHRAQSATRFAVAVRVYRAVARSGPRDNVCGTGVATGDFDPAHPPYDPNCTLDKISSWLDDTPKTPIDRFFGFVGKQDVEYGDIQFTMEHMKFVGKPVNVTTAKAPYDGTHRFYADAGHDGFDSAPYYEALNFAWGVPPENAAWALTH